MGSASRSRICSKWETPNTQTHKLGSQKHTLTHSQTNRLAGNPPPKNAALSTAGCSGSQKHTNTQTQKLPHTQLTFQYDMVATAASAKVTPATAAGSVRSRRRLLSSTHRCNRSTEFGLSSPSALPDSVCMARQCTCVRGSTSEGERGDTQSTVADAAHIRTRSVIAVPILVLEIHACSVHVAKACAHSKAVRKAACSGRCQSTSEEARKPKQPIWHTRTHRRCRHHCNRCA